MRAVRFYVSTRPSPPPPSSPPPSPLLLLVPLLRPCEFSVRRGDVKGSSAFAEDEVVSFETLFNEARG